MHPSHFFYVPLPLKKLIMTNNQQAERSLITPTKEYKMAKTKEEIKELLSSSLFVEGMGKRLEKHYEYRRRLEEIK